MGRHVIIWHYYVEVLETDTAPALLVIARLIRHHHAGLKRLVTPPWNQTMWPFIDVQKNPDALANTLPLLETDGPHPCAHQPNQHHPTTARREILARP